MSSGSRPVFLTEPRACPECGSRHIVRDEVRGERVCADCGLVLSESAIDEGPEWAAYSAEERDRLPRTGPPRKPLTGSAGLATFISYANRDGRGHPLTKAHRREFRRLRALQRMSARSRDGERALSRALRTLDRFVSLLELPDPVRDNAARLSKRALAGHVTEGRTLEGVVAATLYAACRLEGVPRTLVEIGTATGVSRKVVARDYRALLRSRIMSRVPASRPSEYVGRFCSELEVDSRAEAETLRILQEYEKTRPVRAMSPPGIAAAAIYLACRSVGEPRPEETVARIAGVTAVTLRHQIALLRDRTAFLSTAATGE